MSADASHLRDLINACLDDWATEEQFRELNQLLRTDETARDLYLKLLDTHACLSVEEQIWIDPPLPRKEVEARSSLGIHPWYANVWARPRLLCVVAASVLLAVGLIVILIRPSVQPPHADKPPVAIVTDLLDTRWVSPTAEVHIGDAIQSGQRLEISSGSASLEFSSGARLRLIGPAVLEAISDNSAFLLLGQAAVVAETPSSKGFVLLTRTSKLIDIGTRFIASSCPDGQSRVDVSVGSVHVGLNGIQNLQHLNAGDALCIEPGERQIMTRIESGDGTAAFRFPTIEPPSHEDYADQSRHHATIRVVRGQLSSALRGQSGPVSVLIDGRGQSHEDAPEDSAFFPDDTTGSFLMDLGNVVRITKINTYSWHQNTTSRHQRTRAVQKYTLYGFAGDTLPGTDGDLLDLGWVRVARVNSDDYFRVAEPLDRPAQQACSITSARGEIGRYRYLLWEVEPTPGILKASNNTFYGEFDVYADEAQ